jgi:hypothetical protein
MLVSSTDMNIPMITTISGRPHPPLGFGSAAGGETGETVGPERDGAASVEVTLNSSALTMTPTLKLSHANQQRKLS